ncbi:MAG: branched-chain amino acid ABC transporter permease [Acidimicrobiales bacterium]
MTARLFGRIGALWVLIIAATYIGSLGGTSLDRAVINGLILMTVGVGISIFVGTSGVFSFGHIAFMAIGGYTAAILTMSDRQQGLQLDELPNLVGDVRLNPVAATIVAGCVAAIVAAVVAIPLMRLGGLAASLATVALLITVRVVFQNWERFTRGNRGLILDATRPSRESILVWCLIAVAVAAVFRVSPIGRRLAASREDEPAARALGVRVWWERGVAWVLSAFIVGVGGALFALFFRNINPDSFYISLTFTVLAMLVVGGLKSLSGAVVGAITLTVVLETLREVERGMSIGGWEIPSRNGVSELGLATVLLLILITRPDGLLGVRELRLPARATAVFSKGGSVTGSAPDETPVSPDSPESHDSPEAPDGHPAIDR